jgi:hypothetical protein
MHDAHEPNGKHPAEPEFPDHTFPSETEWLSLPVPDIAADFVERTLAARQFELAAEDDGDVAGHLLTHYHLQAHAAPEPSADFVARTVRSVFADRQQRWREALAKYVTPEPSPTFVSKTLAALAKDHVPPVPALGARRSRLRLWPLLALAASVAIVLAIREPTRQPLEQRLAEAARPAWAVGYATSPLPAILATLERENDPGSLPSGGADGMHLLLHRGAR